MSLLLGHLQLEHHMELFSHKECASFFGFEDLHAFKDFIGEVIVCAPDGFIEMDWQSSDDQMNLDRAFIGLRYGLDITAKEKGELPIVYDCRQIVEEAYRDYLEGREIEGQKKLEEMEKLLNKIPSQ